MRMILPILILLQTLSPAHAAFEIDDLNASGSVTASQFYGPVNGTCSNASSVPWSGVTTTPTSLSGYGITDALNSSSVGAANGIAGLDSNAKVAVGNLPDYLWAPTQIGIDDYVVITQPGSGQITVPEARVSFYETSAKLKIKQYTVAETTLTVTEATHQWVVADRNSFTWVLLSDDTLIDYDRYIPLANVFRNTGSNSVHVQIDKLQGEGNEESMYDRLIHTTRYARASGGTSPAIDSSLKLTNSGLNVYAANHLYTIPAITTASRGFHLSKSGGVWSASSTVNRSTDNTHYQDPNGSEQTLTDTYYTIAYYFRGIEDDDHWYEQMSCAQYATLDEAKAEKSIGCNGEIAPLIDTHAIFFARYIVQKSATSGLMESAFTATFGGASSIVNHNSLSGLQGGSTSERYHLTAAQNTIATQAATSSLSGYLTSTDWTTFNGKQDALGYTPLNKAGDTMNGLLTMHNYGVQFDTVLANPATSEGLLFYDQDYKMLGYYADSLTDPVHIGHVMMLQVKNNTGSTLAKGAVTYISGAAGGYPTVDLARADSEATSKSVLVILQSISNGSTGWALQSGMIHNLDTSAWTEGTLLYLSASSAGTLSATAPTGANYKVPVAIVTKQNASTGELAVSQSTPREAVVQIARGGSGQTTAQAAMDTFAGATTSGQYLRGNGSNVVMSAIQVADIPTLNQNTTGTASNVTGTVAIANGGTGQTTKTAAYDNLSPNTTKGDMEVHDGANNVRMAAGTNGLVLTADSTTATGLAYKVPTIPYFEATATGTTTRGTASYAQMASMTLTPGAGTYLATFSTYCTHSTAGGTVQVAIRTNSVVETASVRIWSPSSTSTDRGVISTQAIVAPTAGQVVDVAWQSSATTATCNDRSLILVRLQ